ncbi:hypothetical protein [Bacillus sp. EB01]|uniref:hypothetical protein n=1 Tax=Bacillus sp. EB01 TaxID=1347086 RepID=UPI0005C62271|nr:hypothetical protein [Bacillus sp. EB01]
MLKISDKAILETHGSCILEGYYDFITQNKSEKAAVISQMTHLRPLIEYYQKTTLDLKGERLDFISDNLRTHYFSASKMIHPESHSSNYCPKQLKDDFKLLYKSLFGKKEYKKLKKKVKLTHFKPTSLLSL